MPSTYRPPMPPRIRAAVSEALARINDNHNVPFTLDALVGPPRTRKDICPCCGAPVLRSRAIAEVRAEIWDMLRSLEHPTLANPRVEDIAAWFDVDHSTVSVAIKRRREKQPA